MTRAAHRPPAQRVEEELVKMQATGVWQVIEKPRVVFDHGDDTLYELQAGLYCVVKEVVVAIAYRTCPTRQK